MLNRNTPMQTLTSVYYVSLAVAYAGRLSNRIADGRMRRLLTAVAWMIVIFFLLRCLKYYAFHGNDLAVRMLWYLYYFPMLFLPTISFWAALAMDADGKKIFERLRALTGIVSGGLLACVLTNDLHQMVFRFLPGLQNWDSDYQYGLVYYAVAAWTILMFAGSVVVLTKKCHVSLGKRLFWVPLIPVGLGFLYSFLYVLGMPPKWNGINVVEFPEVASFVVACFWECCICIGLIPSNEGYDELFNNSDLAVQITDADGNVKFSSATAVRLSKEQMNADVQLNENTVLRRAPIRGGFVYWQSDVSKLNALNEELKELEERLSEETELIRLKNEDQIKRAAIDEKNRVYDKIAEAVRTRSQKIASLAQMAEEQMAENEGYQESMRWICFYGTFLKRFANLMLLAEGHETLPVGELSLATSETLHALSELGVSVSKRDESEGEIASRLALNAYETLQRMLECMGENLRGVYVRLTKAECKVVLEGERIDFPEDLAAAVSLQWEDDACYARLSLLEGGEVR